MKKIKMTLLILILTVIIIESMPAISMARVAIHGGGGGGTTDVGDTTHGEINTDVYKGGTTVTTADAGRLASTTANILAIIRNVGIISAVVVLSIIGIKYMLGSLDEKANYKENMLIYVVGCFLLAMATTIPSIVYDIMK